MILAIVLAFAVGLGVGLVLGRRREPSDRPAVEFVGLRSKRAKLPDEAFVPNDDILERLRLAAEGKLDPAEVGGDEKAAASPAPSGGAEPPLPRPELTEAERRVLDRLRNQRPDPDPDPGGP